MKIFNTIEEEVESLMTEFESIQTEDPIEYRKAITKLYKHTIDLIPDSSRMFIYSWLEAIEIEFCKATTCEELIKFYEKLSELALCTAKDIDDESYDYSGEDDYDKILKWRNR